MLKRNILPCGGGYSDLSSKDNELNRYDFIKNSKKGAILIEFAFAVPVLFSLIYYISDLARYKQIQQRMQFVAQEIASNLQNIAKMKGGALTSTDLNNAVRSANLSIFPGKTQYSQNNSWNGGPLGYIPITRVHYIVGTGPNEAEIKWCCRRYPQGREKYYNNDIQEEHYSSETKIKSWKGAPSDIYPDLSLSENEVKIIVEHKFETDRRDSRIFGFYFLNPLKTDGQNNNKQLFNSIVIFSPVPGAFSETLPQ